MNTFFYNEEFEVMDVQIPKFELKTGTVVRIYAPNFSSNGSSLGINLVKKIITRFQKQNPDFYVSPIINQPNTFDRLDFRSEKELFNNIQRIELTESSQKQIYK